MNRRANLKLVAIDGDLVVAEEAPAIDPVGSRAANDAVPRPGWRSLPALALSLTAHAALLAVAATYLTRAEGEAETDSVAIEIIFEAPPSVAAEPAPAEVAEAEAAEDAPEIAAVTVETEKLVPPPDAATEALLAEPPVVEAVEPELPEPVEADVAPPTFAETAETAEIVPPQDTATEALLDEPPFVATPEPEAAEPTEAPAAVEPAAAEPAEPIAEPAATVAPVETAEIVPPRDPDAEALLAEPPVIEPEARQAIEPVEAETIELPPRTLPSPCFPYRRPSPQRPRSRRPPKRLTRASCRTRSP